MKEGEVRKNIVSRGIGFVDDSWTELKKVHPPTRQEATQATIVVILLVVFFSLFLGLTDQIVGNVMQAVLT